LKQIRERAQASARDEICRDFGHVVLDYIDRDQMTHGEWFARYLEYFYTAFAYFAAISKGASAAEAAEIVSEPEIKCEIEARVAHFVARVAS
jgi:hypothetical protein